MLTGSFADKCLAKEREVGCYGKRLQFMCIFLKCLSCTCTMRAQSNSESKHPTEKASTWCCFTWRCCTLILWCCFTVVPRYIAVQVHGFPISWLIFSAIFSYFYNTLCSMYWLIADLCNQCPLWCISCTECAQFAYIFNREQIFVFIL